MRNRLLELFGLCRGDVSTAQQMRCDNLVLNLRATVILFVLYLLFKQLSKWQRYKNALENLQQNVEEPPIQSDQQV